MKVADQPSGTSRKNQPTLLVYASRLAQRPESGATRGEIFRLLLPAAALLLLGLLALTNRADPARGFFLPRAALFVGVVLVQAMTFVQQWRLFRERNRWRQQDALSALVNENKHDIVTVIERNGTLLYGSPSYRKILGYTAHELRGAPLRDMIHPQDWPAMQDAIQKAATFSSAHLLEYRLLHRDGSWHFFESTVSAVQDGRKQCERLIVVHRDISERKRLEREFHQIQKLEAVGRLSGGIAHDFNNLLGVIIGYAEMLEEKFAPKHPLRSSVTEILGASHRAADLVRQLMAFSRQQVLHLEVLDLNEIVAGMERILRRVIGEDVTIVTALDPSLDHIKADQGQLEQIILNLAVNSRDAMPNGGELHIGTANLLIDETGALAYPYPVVPGSYVLLTVRDNGVGIDPATQTRIFEPFFTTKEKGVGTGMGLAAVYGVVKQSGGYISVASEVGQGAVFRILLPKAIEHSELATERPSLEAPELKGTILLAEDEEALRVLTKNMLEMEGYTVLDAGNGMEALALLRSASAEINLLITDLVMPIMGGQALAAQVSALYPQVSTIFISGYTGQTFAGRGALKEGSHFLSKPYTRSDLLKEVRLAFARGRPESLLV